MPARRAPRGRGSVFEDKARGRWVAQLKVGGKLLRKYAASEAEAWDLRDNLVSDARLGVSTSTTRLAEYLAEWLETLRLRPSTVTGYRAKVRLYLAPAPLGTVTLSRLAPVHLRRLFKDLEERQLAPATIRQTRAILQSALRQAQEDGLVGRNVAALVKPPALERAAPRALTPDQARTLLESLRGNRLEALYATTVLLGLRQGEVLGLRWQDLDLEGRVLHVEQTLGRQGGAYFTGRPKTESSRRSLPMPEVLVAALSARQVSQKAEFLKSGARPEHDLVFTTKGGNPVNGSWLTHDLYRRLEAAGLPVVRFHDLRHAAASLLLAEGFGPREIMLVLGHSTIALTMDVYAHVPDATITAKMGRLDEWRAR